jgi:hypothetical protein
MVQAVAGSTIALTIVLVTAHIVSRRIARASIWWDDGLLWFGSGITLVMNALFIHGKNNNADTCMLKDNKDKTY